MKLLENGPIRAMEARFKGFPAAQQSPRVMVGANLVAETFWLGAKMDEWAPAGFDI
jgi:purine nucleoside permease